LFPIPKGGAHERPADVPCSSNQFRRIDPVQDGDDHDLLSVLVFGGQNLFKEREGCAETLAGPIAKQLIAEERSEEIAVYDVGTGLSAITRIDELGMAAAQRREGFEEPSIQGDGTGVHCVGWLDTLSSTRP